MSTNRNQLFFIDRIEHSSYPVTETGYALVYRAWRRALEHGGEVYIAYPDCEWHETSSAELRVLAHRVVSFSAAPYKFYRDQRSDYRPGADVGSPRCHSELPARELSVNALDAVVWRQERGEPERTSELLHALTRVERDTVVYLSPQLALDPRLGSKVLPRTVDAHFTPRTHHTNDTPLVPHLPHDSRAVLREKAQRVVEFVRKELDAPQTVIAKPLHGNNGFGIRALGRDPVSGEQRSALDALETWVALLARYGDLVVQEYIASVRSPVGHAPEALAAVPLDRRDFGEIRFLLIDGALPPAADGGQCLVARRVPSPDSLIADSGISYATSLSAAELAFLQRLGPMYRRLGIYFGGGDLIRTPDPARPFVFTDAARSVCGHAVVTGALNGAPYLIIDQILDSLDRRIASSRGDATAPKDSAHPPADHFTNPR